MEITALAPVSASFLRDAYARMLLTRMVDECACKLYEEGQIGFVASCRGHEAAQVGSAVCIEVGKDFTLPYDRDLGVVLTIGMTPYEVFRTYLLAHRRQNDEHRKFAGARHQRTLHWGYHKHNMITGAGPVATQILHAAGIAFACKLRKAPAVTVAYCGDGATGELDFLEGITFAAQHQLPVVFICEQDGVDARVSALQGLTLPGGLEHCCVDGADVVAVYRAMQTAMRHARDGDGPVLLEMRVKRSLYGQSEALLDEEEVKSDPLLCCQQMMKEQGMWDEEGAEHLYARTQTEVEQALEDALRDVG